MSGPVGSSTWFGEPGYNINQSLRFEDGSSTTLTRTPASDGNRKTWSFSVWFKLANLTGATERILNMEPGNAGLYITSTGQIGWIDVSDSNFVLNSDRLLRDPGAWYHIVLNFDSTQGTASNRLKAYLNGELIAFTNEGGYDAYPDENEDGRVNKASVKHIIGGYREASQLWDGYLAEVNFIDGLTKVPADFATTGAFGEWIPIEYTGAYGTNGFYLTFAGGGIMSATGGNSTATDGDFKAASFTANGTFTPSADGFVEYLVIAGGGAGAADGATTAGNGGGGAGGYRTGMLPVTASTGYSITVGAGGVGALSASGVNGANSVFSSITSAGGGGGGYFTSTPGSGGGSGGGGSAQTAAGGAATPAGQGNAGETATNAAGGGGGGGAGEAGGTDGTGQGGDGLASSITGSSVTRAGGGGGSRASGGARAGGDGGGGAGGNGGAGADGSTNTGSGGGAGVSGGESGSGGSGIVIIRYKYQ